MDLFEQEEQRRFREMVKACDPHSVWGLHRVLATFRAEREDSAGQHQDLMIEVHFDGNAYHVEVFAQPKRGKRRMAWGSWFTDLSNSLASIGWDDLDEDPDNLTEHRASPGSWSVEDLPTNTGGG